MAGNTFKNKKIASAAGKKGKRGKGTNTIILRNAISDLLSDNYDRFEKEILALKGTQFVDRLITLLEYVTPKLNRTDLTTDGQPIEPITGTIFVERVVEKDENKNKTTSKTDDSS